MIKNYLKSYLYLFGIMIILTIISSIISYFARTPMNILNTIIPILSVFIASIILGVNTKEKAYLEGIKFSLVYLLFITIMKFILKTNFNFKVIIIYLIIIVISILGSMIGINLKKK